MAELLWMLLIAFVVGLCASLPAKGFIPGGLPGTSIAAFAGSWLGNQLLGTFGPDVSGFPVIPAFIGAVGFLSLICVLSKVSSRMA